MNELLMTTFNNLGKFGPGLMMFLTINLLWDKKNLFNYYIYGYFLDSIINIVLKGIIRFPRPSEDPKLFELALKNGERFKFKHGFPHDIFGMPSGHAQSAFYTTVYTFLALKNTRILCFYLLCCIIIVSQRVVYNYHTVTQVIIGGIVGSLFAYCIFYMTQQNIVGQLKQKEDDNAYI